MHFLPSSVCSIKARQNDRSYMRTSVPRLKIAVIKRKSYDSIIIDIRTYKATSDITLKEKHTNMCIPSYPQCDRRKLMRCTSHGVLQGIPVPAVATHQSTCQ